LDIINGFEIKYYICKYRIKNFSMTKFGELIGSKTPTLIDFYTDWEGESTNLHSILRDVAAALGDKAKVVKIDVSRMRRLQRL
jgi:thioredoxin-like negative regulator of GroEL